MINQPGIYDITDEAYHADPVDPWSVSRGMLWHMVNGPRRNPLKAWASHPKLGGITSGDKPAFNFGRAAHMLVLQPDVFAQKVVVKPDDYVGNANIWKQWLRDQKDMGKTVVSKNDEKKLYGMAASIKRDKTIMAILADGQFEQTAIAQDKMTGLWMRCKPDFLPNDPRQAPADFKTAESADLESFERACANYGYPFQAGFYSNVMEETGRPRLDFYTFVVIENKAPHATAVYYLDGFTVSEERRVVRDAMIELSDCVKNNHWPSYNGGHAVEAKLPYYEVNKMETRQYRSVMNEGKNDE